MRVQRVPAAALLLAGALAVSGCGGGKDDDRVAGRTLRIYASVPLTGPSAQAGRDVADAERLALVRAGGRAGRFRVSLVVEDATDPKQRHWTPAVVAANARRAAHDPSTIAYLGEVDPASSAVSVVILNQAGIVALAPTDSFAGITRPEGNAAAEPAKYYPKRTRTWARLVPDDVLQARAVVRWMRRSGVRRPLLLDDDDIYGRSLAEQVDREARGAGLHPVERDAIDLDNPPFRSDVDHAVSLRPDGVFLGATPQPGVPGLLAAFAAALGPVPLFLPGALAAPGLLARLSPSAQAEIRLTDPVAAVATDTRRARVDAAFAARYHRRPTAAAAFGYEAMAAVLAALDEEGHSANRRAAVMRALLSRRARGTALGAYALLPGGRTSRRAIGLFRLVGGILRRSGTMFPSG